MIRSNGLVVAALVLVGCAFPRVSPMSDTPHLFRLILPVADIERAAEFYGAVFGVPGHRISPGRHYFDCGGTIVACYCAAADGDAQPVTPLPDWIYFSVEDLEATQRRCEAAGAARSDEDIDGTPAWDIVVRPWGERSFYCVDPFGNKICFVDRATAFTGS